MEIARLFTLLSLFAIAALQSSCDRSSGNTALISASVGKTAPQVPSSLPDEVGFNEHIQPILSENCYHCHGPDSSSRKPKDAPLRFDRPEDAFTLRENGKPVIIKGDPEASRLVEVLFSTDKDEHMPPYETHKKLTDREIGLIKRWIQQGAKYQPHWSFTELVRPKVPPTAGESENPIDHFIAAKLGESGMKPNPPEDPRRFHRRLALDLTGLPPAADATDAFVKNYAADPEKAVATEADAMMETTAHAEHMARHWLDAARYADTHGIHIDNYRSIWPYRDWVINAFHGNMPWDQFTVEQIAGDLMPSRTLDQQVATGFNRCLATTGEGGAIGEEYDAIYAKDRVDTTSAVWLGLTTGCAACHDHKFDPISQKDFYSFSAFFRNTPMTALDGNDAVHPPNVFVPAVSERARYDQLAAEIEATTNKLAARAVEVRPAFERWLVSSEAGPKNSSDSSLVLNLPLTEDTGPIHGKVEGKPRQWENTLTRIDGPLGKAPVISESPLDLGDLGSFKRGDSVTYGGFIRVEGAPTGAVVARMNPGQGFKGWDLYLGDGYPGGHVIDTWDTAANKIVAPQPLTPGKWHHVMISFDGTLPSEQAMTLYVDGEPQTPQVFKNTVGANIETSVSLKLGSREGGDSKLNGPVALQDFRFYRRLLTRSQIANLAIAPAFHELAAIPAPSRSKEQMDKVLPYYLAEVDTISHQLNGKLELLKKSQNEIKARGGVTLVMEEKPEEAFAHILVRGVYTAKTDRVTAATPSALPAMAASSPKNRLGLAKWLVDPANPLTARVTMNRTWYYFFGTGIVETTEDFGIMGARPSHPQLLDWLAAEFVAAKWDYRHMLQLIVTSQTYRQSGAVSPEKLEKDPLNRLLSRGPRNRLDAEQLRDLALISAGLLKDKVGGPSVKPYQPEGLWEAVAMDQSDTRFYKQDSGDALYRRSLYTFWKRTAAPASMEILNAPTRETFCVRRDRTDTPLQALVLLNDPQFVESARQLAAHAMTASPEFDLRLDHITRQLIDRVLQPSERKIIRASLDELLATFTAKPDQATELLAVGATPAPILPAPELAAWTMVASQILNLDETLTH
jgi:hypothetical protein